MTRREMRLILATAAVGLLCGALLMAVASAAAAAIVLALGLAVCGAAAAIATRAAERRRRAEHAEARRDPLTGLPNVVKLREDIARLLDAPDPQPRALTIYDFVGFKKYNDSYGFACGDTLLRRIVRKLEAALDGQGVAYRMRGAQIAVLNRMEPDAVHALAQRATEALHEIGEGFMIRSARGTVFLPDESGDLAELLKLADQRVQADRTTLRAEGIDEVRHVSADPKAGARMSAPRYGVAALAVPTGRLLGLPEAELEVLESAAQLRDVGMMSVPDAIVHGTGRLSDHDWEFIRLHTLVGERILRSNFGMDAVAAIVRSSHERHDGEGYPDGLAGDQIPLGSRIVFVCSAFQDMTSERAHRAASTTDEALEELRRCAGTQFDGAVVEMFVSTFREHEATAKPGAVDDGERR